MNPIQPIVGAAQWFNVPMTNSLPVASTPGVFEWAAAAWFGRVEAHTPRRIRRVHLHLDEAHANGNMKLELWRNRGQGYGPGSSPGTMTLLATLTAGAGENDGASFGFAFSDNALRQLITSDYLHLQATEEPAGGTWKGFIDVHYYPRQFRPE